jgi:hypothetical protein
MDADFRQAVENGKLVNQGFNRCIAYVNAWMKFADTTTGPIQKISGMPGMQQQTTIPSWY